MTKYDLRPYEFWLKVDQYAATHPDMRYGQVIFNMLDKYKPEHARHIVGTDLDPFHDTTGDVSLACAEWLARHWLDEFE